MTESEWLTSENPGLMLDYLKMGFQVSDRKLRRFVVVCLCRPNTPSGLPSWGDWERWEKETHDTPPYFTSPEGALFAAGRKVWQSDPGTLAPQELARRANLLREIVGNPFREVTVQQTVSCQRCQGTGQAMGARMGPTCTGCSGMGHVRQPCPWITPEVHDLAQAAYDNLQPDGTLDPARLAVLSDALEEAGCDNQQVLRHLRGEEPVLRPITGLVPQVTGHPTHRVSGWRPLRGPHVRGCWALDLILGKGANS